MAFSVTEDTERQVKVWEALCKRGGVSNWSIRQALTERTVSVGDARARLRIVGNGVVEADGRQVPMLRVENTGNAHGRLEGFLEGVDPTGERWTLAPVGNPILPGMTRDIPLYPLVNDDAPVEL